MPKESSSVGDGAQGPVRIRPYNVRIGDRRTSIRLVEREWEVLIWICRRENVSVHQFCTDAVMRRGEPNRTSRIRVALLEYCFRLIEQHEMKDRGPG